MLNLLDSYIIPAVGVLFLLLCYLLRSGKLQTWRSKTSDQEIEKKGKSVTKVMIFSFSIAAIFHAMVFVELLDNINSTFTAVLFGVLLALPIYTCAMLVVGAYSVLCLFLGSDDKDA